MKELIGKWKCLEDESIITFSGVPGESYEYLSVDIDEQITEQIHLSLTKNGLYHIGGGTFLDEAFLTVINNNKISIRGIIFIRVY